MTNTLFVHIGYHKTGTTWLQETVFNRHPQIAYLGKAKDYPAPGVIDIFHSLYEDSDVGFSVEQNQERWQAALKMFPLTSSHKILGLSDEGLSGGIDSWPVATSLDQHALF